MVPWKYAILVRLTSTHRRLVRAARERRALKSMEQHSDDTAKQQHSKDFLKPGFFRVGDRHGDFKKKWRQTRGSGTKGINRGARTKPREPEELDSVGDHDDPYMRRGKYRGTSRKKDRVLSRKSDNDGRHRLSASRPKHKMASKRAMRYQKAKRAGEAKSAFIYDPGGDTCLAIAQGSRLGARWSIVKE